MANRNGKLIGGQVEQVNGRGGIREQRSEAAPEWSEQRSGYAPKTIRAYQSSNTVIGGGQVNHQFSLENTVLAVDWLETRIHVDWDPKKREKLLADLRVAKEMAGQVGSSWTLQRETTLPVRVEWWGAKRKGEFALNLGGFHLFLTRDVALDRYSAFLEAKGDPCLVWGASGVLDMVKTTLSELGGSYVRSECPTRADVCADLPGFDVREWVQSVKENNFQRWRHRAIHCDPQRPDENGFTIGGGGKSWNGLLVGYDKRNEVAHKQIGGNVPWDRMGEMVEKRWGGAVPEQAARLEFRVRRPELKRLGIESAEEFISEAASVFYYGIAEWCQVYEKVYRRSKNQSKSQLLPSWESLQKVVKIMARDKILERAPLAPRQSVNPGIYWRNAERWIVMYLASMRVEDRSEFQRIIGDAVARSAAEMEPAVREKLEEWRRMWPELPIPENTLPPRDQSQRAWGPENPPDNQPRTYQPVQWERVNLSGGIKPVENDTGDS